MKILDIKLKIIPDSRGQDTLESELRSGDSATIASVPSGKSRGVHEAFVLEQKLAIQKFEEIRNEILGKDFTSQEEFDNFLISLDGTPDKHNLGGNLILALSLAFARLKAKDENLELFKYIAQCLGSPMSQKLKKLILGHRTSLVSPTPIFNMINGGAHSPQDYAEYTQTNAEESPRQSAFSPRKSASLEFQEFHVIPEVEDFGLALGIGKEFYEKLGQFLEKKFGKKNIVLGDEAGYSAPFSNNEEAIDCLAEVIEKYHYPLRIGLDVAASQFYEDGFYAVDGKKYPAEELKEYYFKLIKAYNILSIEDPFYEEDFEEFASLTAELRGTNAELRGKLVIADDLTTTNIERLKTAIEKKSGNAIIIKPNQIGTLTETLKVIKLVYENNWQAIVSNRSGETMDDFIADLAVGIGAWGIKAGAPAAPERMVKYQRILEISNI